MVRRITARMRINRLSLLNSLCNILNENEVGNPSVILAEYFLKNYHYLSELNIYQVADDCFVSRSSIRRFCKSIGYNNFAEFKNEIREYDDQYSNLTAHFRQQDFREILTNNVLEAIHEMSRSISREQIHLIARRIHKSRNTLILTSNYAVSAINTFQYGMVLQGKVIRLVSELYETNNLLKEVTADDYVIVISGHGILAGVIEEFLKTTTAYTELFTVNRSRSFDLLYDSICWLSEEDGSHESRSIYMVYGMQYLLDLVYAKYVREYGLKE